MHGEESVSRFGCGRSVLLTNHSLGSRDFNLIGQCVDASNWRRDVTRVCDHGSGVRVVGRCAAVDKASVGRAETGSDGGDWR